MMTIVTSNAEDIENVVLPSIMEDIRNVDIYVSKNRENVNAQDKNGRTMLQYAAEYGDVETVRLLFANDADTDKCDHIHQTPLHWATRNHQPGTVKVLLDHKADVEFPTNKGRTPLQFAAMCSKDKLEFSKEVSQLLLDYNACPLASDKFESCAFDRAWDFHNEPIVRLYETEEEHWKRAMLRSGVKYDSSLYEKHGQDLTGYLKEKHDKRTDTGKDDYEGLLRVASYCGADENVVNLIRKIMDLRDRDRDTDDYDGLLQIASHSGTEESVNALIVNLRDRNRWSALHYAAKKGHISIVKKLLQEHATIDRRDNSKRTPLHISVLHRQGAMVSLLLEWGADYNIEDCFGHTALYYAQKLNFHDITELIEEHKVQQSQEKSSGGVEATLGGHEPDNLLEIKILSGERTCYDWEQGGFKMDVPSDSLPEDVAECTLRVTASLGTNMSLPNDTALVSGVYHIMPPSNVQRFKKPVTIYIEHCADMKPGDENKLSFVIAKAGATNFESLPGGLFSSEHPYGSITLASFSLIAIVSEMWHGSKYYGCVYYDNIQPNSNEVHIVVIKKLSLAIQYVSEEYQVKMHHQKTLKFKSPENQIVLELPVSSPEEGWKLTPYVQELSKNDVDGYDRFLPVPRFQLRVNKTSPDATLKDYTVKCLQTQEETSFTVTCPPPETQPLVDIGNARNRWYTKTAVVSLGAVALCVIPVLPMRLKFKIAMALAVIPGTCFLYALIQNDDPFIRNTIPSVLLRLGAEVIRVWRSSEHNMD